MTLPPASPASKTLVLGTALWGWRVDRATAHQILDRYVALGGRIVDTAANYPINKRPEDFGVAKNWIADWIASNGAELLSVLVKIGAADNMGGPDSYLGRSSILQSEGLFRAHFGAALAALAVHWDNRGDSEADADAIAETVDALAQFSKSGMSIGFSGVRHPEIYLKAAPALADQWWIQVKENALTSAARRHYARAFPDARYLAYGINMGGVKLGPPAESSSLSIRGIERPDALVRRLSAFLHSDHGLRPAPADLNDLALTTSFHNAALSGIIIGPRNIEQLESTMHFWKLLKTESSADMAARLSAITKEPD
jgi:aryl-alcohol dehydrogenase-like predicted oxidoreductase